MWLFKKMMKDRNGNLKDELDPYRARYGFTPFAPTGTTDNYITVPSGYMFYMTGVEVQNTDSANHTFHVEYPSGTTISLEYSVTANQVTTIDFHHQGLTDKVYFVPDTYGKLTFKPIGYLEKL